MLDNERREESFFLNLHLFLISFIIVLFVNEKKKEEKPTKT